MDNTCISEYSSSSKLQNRHCILHLKQNTKISISHVSYVNKPKLFFNRFLCKHCNYIFKKLHHYKRHISMNKCLSNNRNSIKFIGGFNETRPLKIHEKLQTYGLDFQETDFQKKYALFWDFESLQKTTKKTQNANTNYIFKNEPFAYSICGNFEMNIIHRQINNPDSLLRFFVDDLYKLSKDIEQMYPDKYIKAIDFFSKKIEYLENRILLLHEKLSKIKNRTTMYISNESCIDIFYKCSQKKDYLEKSKHLIDNFPSMKKTYSFLKLDIFHCKQKLSYLKSLTTELQDFISCPPAISYGGSNFDINLCRKHLFKYLLKKTKHLNVLKKGNRYLLIKTPFSKFIDMTCFLSTSMSLDNFSKSMCPDNVCHKGYLHYEKLNSFEQLKSHQMPPYDDFYSRLKGGNVFEVDIDTNKYSENDITKMGKQRYNDVKRLWIENQWNLGKYIEYYTNKDVQILADSVMVFENMFLTNFNLSILNFISLPQIARYLLKEECYKNGVLLPRFSNKNSHIYYALKNSLTGGSSQIYQRKCDVNTLISQNKLCKSIYGLDANSLYPTTMENFFPSGQPISYIKNPGDQFFSIEKDINWKKMYVWIDFLAKKYNVEILHALNAGFEQKILGFKTDGYIPLNNQNRHFFDLINDKSNSYKGVCLEFLGCYYHDCCLCGKKRDNYDKLKQCLFKFYQYLKNGYYIIWIFECIFNEQLLENNDLQEIYEKYDAYPFYSLYKNRRITDQTFIENIKNGTFFGFITVSLSIPPYHPYIDFDKWPAFFCNHLLTVENWSPFMLKHFGIDSEGNYTTHVTSRKLLLQTNSVKRITISSELLKFYISCGVKVNHIYNSFEFVKKKPYAKLVKRVIDLRRYSDSIKNECLAQICKLVLNSAFGSFHLNKIGYKNVSYSNDEGIILKKMNSSTFYSINELYTGQYEIINNKSKVIQDTLLYHANQVLDISKAILCDFVWNFFMRCVHKNDFKILVSDTDSIYVALTDSNIEKIVKPSFLEYYKWMIAIDHSKSRCCDNIDTVSSFSECTTPFNKIYFPRECCKSHALFDSRSPNLFKIEKFVVKKPFFIGLSSKKFILKDDTKIVKLSFAGLSKINFVSKNPEVVTKNIKNLFKKPLKKSVTSVGINYNLGVDNMTKNDMLFYSQYRNINSALYLKRYVHDCGIETSALNICSTPYLGFVEKPIYIYRNHYLCLYKTRNILYNNTHFKCLNDLFENIEKTVLFSNLHEVILKILQNLLKKGVLHRNRLTKYKHKLLLFPGKGSLLTTGVNSYTALRYMSLKDIPGKNELTKILNIFIETFDTV